MTLNANYLLYLRYKKRILYLTTFVTFNLELIYIVLQKESEGKRIYSPFSLFSVKL